MIALISFENDIVTTRKEAEELGIDYEVCDRVGTTVGSSRDRLEDMTGSSYKYYIDEVTKGEDDKYYNTAGKVVEKYYIYNRPPIDADYVRLTKNNNMVDLNKFAPKCKYRFYIEKAIETSDTAGGLYNIISVLDDKIKQLQELVGESGTFNEKVNVHMGGSLLTLYNETLLMENCCTDALQNSLNNGWRVMAICVQPDQRRPDYILGRYNPKLSVDSCTEARRHDY